MRERPSSPKSVLGRFAEQFLPLRLLEPWPKAAGYRTKPEKPGLRTQGLTDFQITTPDFLWPSCVLTSGTAG